jgi:hypothetical protein
LAGLKEDESPPPDISVKLVIRESTRAAWDRVRAE